MYDLFLITILSKLFVELISTMPFSHSTKIDYANIMCQALWLRTQAKM